MAKARKRARKPTLPKEIRTKEDIAEFFAYLYLVDKTAFHPDDAFIDADGNVEHVRPDGQDAYMPSEAKKRQDLMDQSWEVASDTGVDLYAMGLWISALLKMDIADPSNADDAPAWLVRLMAPYA